MKSRFVLVFCIFTLIMSVLTSCASMHDQAYRGDLDGIQNCIKAGEDINLPFGRKDFDRNIFENDTPLSISIKQNRTGVVLELLRAGADAKNWRDTFDNTLLHIAPEGLDGAITAALIKAGLDVNARNRFGDTPLNQHAYRANLGPVKELIRAGADVNAPDQYFKFPIDQAIISPGRDNIPVVVFLIESGADPAGKNRNGFKPIFNADGEEIPLLVKYGADVNVATKDGLTPIMYRAGDKNSDTYLQTLQALIDLGADVNAVDKNGNTALHFAASKGTAKGIALLLKAGARVNAFNSMGETPLHLAALEGTTQVVLQLVESGALINAGNKRGETPLHLACKRKSEIMITELINLGADAGIKDNYGYKPIDIMKKRK